jgi:CubicO group peptidase (beta-lactamase class C family)
VTSADQRTCHRRGLRRWALLGVLPCVLAACGSRDQAAGSDASTTAITTTAITTAAASGESSSTTTATASRFALGEFPAFPDTALPEPTTATLQSLLDDAVEQGTFEGVTAAVIVADQGNWAGASGTWDGEPIRPDSRYPTHSSAKTFVAAEILRLVEDGQIGLDDPAVDYLAPELAFFDANGATIREVLGMRSGLPSLDKNDAYSVAELVPTVNDLFEALPEPTVSAGSMTRYSGTNYLLLGSIIEHVTGRPLADTLRSDVLAQPGLEGIAYTVPDAMASDGWGVETTSASLARWGYDLYGGLVIPDASLQEMTDFRGEWYGLGVMDYSRASGVFDHGAIGHQGLSSVLKCCSAVALVALPDDGIVIAVQADAPAGNGGTGDGSCGGSSCDLNPQVDRLAKALAEASRE